ncbi:NADH kinase pos5 [Coemansia sp. RSA 1722]|nr:NADH kinase pos5 [Coemansia sp. RSA 486]KAJ2237021.1 NADH kinase pos5 [Coemansia sp. RSA 485]KAJ2603536.1 NADH kinase pos5 [Coemansia sp. RSA 1721]KAJ2605312.1 NADH kinase pos5 [Coemansia sp. RSA 1722]KAJ2638686.1 NADH kinase pos5 [Coemansia sp. RSA 1286]
MNRLLAHSGVWRLAYRPRLWAQHRSWQRGLRTTVDIATKTKPNLVRQIADPALGEHEGDQQYSLQWQGATPKTVLIVRKANDHQVDSALVRIAQWFQKTYPQINVVLEPAVHQQHSKALPFAVTVPETQSLEYARTVDFVVTLGGDGTFLHVSSLFADEVPPIIPFSMGTLGFLLPFNVADFAAQLRRVVEGAATVLPRMRLVMQRSGSDQLVHVTNEASIHRGTYPHLTTISCFLDGHLLTTSVGDGIIVGTPTGSTAYALSAGGPIVHPLVSSVVLAPVCPRSLSFRPLMLPPTAVVRLQVHQASRGHATAYVDGRDCGGIMQGESVEIRRSQYPLLCVNRDDLAKGWAQDINQLLKFNRTFSHPHETPFGE